MAGRVTFTRGSRLLRGFRLAHRNASRAFVEFEPSPALAAQAIGCDTFVFDHFRNDEVFSLADSNRTSGRCSLSTCAAGPFQSANDKPVSPFWYGRHANRISIETRLSDVCGQGVLSIHGLACRGF